MNVSRATVVTGALWFASGALETAGVLGDRHTLLMLGLWFCGLAATCSVRRMLGCLHARERAAFELGRDLGRDYTNRDEIRAAL